MDADQSDLIDRAIQLQDSVPVSIVADVGQKIGEVVVAIAGDLDDVLVQFEVEDLIPPTVPRKQELIGTGLDREGCGKSAIAPELIVTGAANQEVVPIRGVHADLCIAIQDIIAFASVEQVVAATAAT